MKTMSSPQQSSKMTSFFIIWVGQLVSLLGSGLTNFGLGVWVYQRTQSTFLFTLIALSSLLPNLLLLPISGTIIDRWNRRLIMMLSNVVAALCTLAVVFLLFNNALEIWQIYIATAIISTSGMFLKPAFTASITLLVPEKQLSRANGMVQLAIAASQLLAPVLAGILVYAINIQGVVLIDSATYVVALLTLLLVRIPHTQKESAADEAKKHLFKDAAAGWTYLAQKKGLLTLMIFLGIVSFFVGLVSVLVTPLVLSFTTPTVLGLVLSIGGCGMLVGAATMSIWKGPQRRISLVLGGFLVFGVSLIIGGLQASPLLVTLAAFGVFFSLPWINGSITTIMQRMVEPSMQGRVFSIGQVLASIATPLSYLIAGSLADRVFEPLLKNGGALNTTVGKLIGVGAGRGTAFLFILVGTLLILIATGAYFTPRLRFVEGEKDTHAISQEQRILVSNEAKK